MSDRRLRPIATHSPVCSLMRTGEEITGTRVAMGRTAIRCCEAQPRWLGRMIGGRVGSRADVPGDPTRRPGFSLPSTSRIGGRG